MKEREPAATATYHTSPIHLYVATTHYLSLVSINTKHHILSPLPPVVPFKVPGVATAGNKVEVQLHPSLLVVNYNPGGVQ